jgi:2-(1,2-epoxy-1,2-dihydrophenyl)acetyl-CoA isomerase
MNGTGLVLRSDRDGVAELRLNRPGNRNALSTALLAELRDHLVAVQADRTVRVVLFTAAGPAFSAGADLHEFGSGTPAAVTLPRIRLVVENLRRIGELEQPTLAAVHGPAVGAGWGLALACDLCFAAEPATFALPEVVKGLRLPALLVTRLVQIVGPVRAADIIFGGEVRDSAAALATGWVSRVLPTPDDLTTGARAFAAALAARPLRALTSAKHPLRQLAPRTPFPPTELAWIEE